MMSNAEAAMLRLILASLAQQQHEKTGQRRKFDRGRADQQYRQQQQQQKRRDSILNVIFNYT